MLFDDRLYYVVEGSGPPIVFLHGFGLDHRMWENQIKFFSPSYKTVSIDMRGFGKSPPPAVQAFAYHEDVAELLEFLHIDQPVVLVGNSMGGRICANFALAYPEKTKAIVFVNAAIDGYTFKDFDRSEIYLAGRTQGVRVANQMWLEHPAFEPARKNPLSMKLLKEIITSSGGWHWTNKAPLKNPAVPAYEQLENIKSPALIIIGQNDLADFAIIAETLHQKIAGSLKKEIAGAGHVSNMEKPEEFNALVNQFLVRIKY